MGYRGIVDPAQHLSQGAIGHHISNSRQTQHQPPHSRQWAGTKRRQQQKARAQTASFEQVHQQKQQQQQGPYLFRGDGKLCGERAAYSPPGSPVVAVRFVHLYEGDKDKRFVEGLVRHPHTSYPISSLLWTRRGSTPRQLTICTFRSCFCSQSMTC